MKIKRVKIENVLSIGALEFVFSDSGLVLVDGFDHDKGRFNGAGKSSIFNALSWGLFEELPRKITATEILKRGAKAGFVEVDIETQDGLYTVRRERPNKLLFFKDGQPETMRQAEFETKIGFNYEQFILSVYCPQDARSRFIFLNDTGKKDFLLKLMNLGAFDSFKDRADEEVESAESTIETNKKTADQLQFSNNLLKSKLVDEAPVLDQIDKLTEITKELEDKSASILPVAPDFSKYDALEKAIAEKKEKFSAIRAEIGALDRQRASLAKSFNHSFVPGQDIPCPVCSAALRLRNNTLLKAEDVDGQKKAHEEERARVQSQVDALSSEALEKTKLLAEAPAVDALVLKIAESKKKDSAAYTAAMAEMKRLDSEISNNYDDISSLKNSIAGNAGIKSQIESNDAAIKKYLEEADKAAEVVLLYKEVASIFGPTGAPAYIMDSVVEAFNERVGEYVAATWPNASYTLQAFKENKDKSIKAKFSESLIIDGKSCSVGSISGGELTSLSLAVDFALFDTVSSMFGIDCNIMIFDEPFTGIDALGKEAVMETLKKMSEKRQVFVIDHSTEIKAIFDSVIKIEKRNGTSSLVQ